MGPMQVYHVNDYVLVKLKIDFYKYKIINVVHLYRSIYILAVTRFAYYNDLIPSMSRIVHLYIDIIYKLIFNMIS